MLPAQARLRSPDEFRATVRGGVRSGRGTLVVHARRTTAAHAGDASPLASPRVGFVVSKAVGNAVTRNRVKRRLRHLAAAELPSTRADTDVVVRALPPAAVAADLARDFHAAWLGALRKLES